MREGRNNRVKCWYENLKEEDRLKDTGRDGT
jgi:hypothetical protein